MVAKHLVSKNCPVCGARLKQPLAREHSIFNAISLLKKKRPAVKIFAIKQLNPFHSEKNFLFVILYEYNKEFIVHRINLDTGGLENGEYGLLNYEDALKKFIEKT